MSDRPLRVLHVLHRLSRHGGVQATVRAALSAVDPADVEFHVVTARPELAADGLDGLPAVLHPLGRSGPIGPGDRLAVVGGVARTVRRVRPDVVHLHSGTTWMAGSVLLRSVPGFRADRPAVVAEVHDAPGSGRHGALTDVAESLWFRCGAVAVVHSSAVEADVRRRWRVPESRVVRYPLPVDTDRFRPWDQAERIAWRAAHGLDPSTVVVATAGRVVPSKRVDLTLQAVDRLCADGMDVAALVVGDGESVAPLRSLSASMGRPGRFVFTGALDDAGFASALAASDLLCVPSEYEGFGLTTLEGMAAGLPVVATEVGGTSDLVRNGVTGLLVASGDVAAIVAAVRDLVEDPAVRRRLGEAGRKAAVAYSGARFSSDLLAAYRVAMGGPAVLVGGDRKVAT